jgi:hypothetical protein
MESTSSNRLNVGRRDFIKMSAATAAERQLSCKTTRMSKSFIITKDKVTLYKEHEVQGRALASIEKVKTKLSLAVAVAAGGTVVIRL